MFELETTYVPCGDQPKAIDTLVANIQDNRRSQVLLGITGSGKTFTIANLIARVKKPTIIIAHNKTLAAQLYQEFRSFFPRSAVEYFVSYYDYYQPEAYIPRTDTYIEKDFAINDKIDKMRLSATRSLLERDDVIIVASVSCIYGLGSPEYYKNMNLTLTKGQERRRDDLLLHLVDMQYKRNDVDFSRGTFRVRGDVIDIFPAYEEDRAVRVEMWGDEVEKISEFDPLTGRKLREIDQCVIYPSSHHVTPGEIRHQAIDTIRQELHERMQVFEQENKLIELQRIRERVMYDIEMIKEIGFCKGIENYSRHFGQRLPGAPPPCLLDYFPSDFLMIIDESHQTVPQLRAMCHGDRARKKSLIDFGFRLPSAYDNRPLGFDEVYQKMHQVVYVSATPDDFEVQEAGGEVIEQIIRPTGLLDPKIEVRKASTQVDDCLHEIHQEVKKGFRVLVTTLTKKLSEELTKYLQDLGVRAKYLHADVDTLERIEILRDLRQGKCDVIVGINLLREGLDLPEVSLVAILDADREGFLRSTTSLVQTCGRAARNEHGRVIMYADTITKSMQATIDITERRRKIQHEYNVSHHITPKTVYREIGSMPLMEEDVSEFAPPVQKTPEISSQLTIEEIRKKIKELERGMKQAAKALDFEEASRLRDEMRFYQELELQYT